MGQLFDFSAIDWRQVLNILLTVCYAFVWIGVLLTILLENRNPSKALCYIVVMVFVPVLGLAVYYFVGRDWRKRKRFSAKRLDNDSLQHFYRTYKKLAVNSQQQITEFASQGNPLPQFFLNAKQSLLTSKNNVTLLTNGEEKFHILYQALEAATHHIHIEYYIFSKDDVGLRIQEILLRKLSEGVEVRVIYDYTGSNRIKDIPKVLLAHGAEVYPFEPITFRKLGQANNRDHRKIVIVDGRIGFMGGINADDRYLNNGKHQLFWRDTHLLVEGEAAGLLQLQFLLNYNYLSDKTFPFSESYFPSPHTFSGNSPIDVVGSGPDSNDPWNMDAILLAINSAKHELKITTPYFIPSDEILRAMTIAATSGVSIELLIPQVGDSAVVQHATNSYIGSLLSAGVKVYLYHKGFSHAKTMVVDDLIGMVGTVNMDIRSFYCNFEIAAYVYDPVFINQLRTQFDNDLNDGIRVDPEVWNNRPFRTRLADAVCRLISPLL